MDGVKADRAAKQPHEDPLYNLDGIILTLATLKKETDAIFARPAPKVVVPTAVDALLSGSGDAKMKDEKAPEGGAKGAEPAATEEKKGGDAEMKNEEAK